MFLAGCDNMAGEASRFKASKSRIANIAATDQVTERITCNFVDENNVPMTTAETCFSDMGHTCIGAGSCFVSVTEKKDLTLIWKSKECKPIDANGNVIGYLKTIMDGTEETLNFRCEGTTGLTCDNVDCNELNIKMVEFNKMDEAGQIVPDADYNLVKNLLSECCDDNCANFNCDSIEVKNCLEQQDSDVRSNQDTNCNQILASYSRCCESDTPSTGACVDCEYRLTGEFFVDGIAHHNCVEVCRNNKWYKAQCTPNCCGDTPDIPGQLDAVDPADNRLVTSGLSLPPIIE